MIILIILLILLGLISIPSYNKKCKCGSEDFEYILPGNEESLCCSKCGKSYYSIED